MEPADAKHHYTEQLIPLPGVGLCYAKPTIPDGLLFKQREDFGLRNDAVVYLSAQTIFKYLPEQDTLFAEVAQRLPSAQFVFLLSNEIVKSDFESRLQRTFERLGLRVDDHCVFLPEVPRLDYLNLHKLSNVVLDTVGWSGGVSTFEAIACRLPVVTYPGRFMRGRQSYAILKQLGVEDTIASSEADYVEIAVRLGNDPEWRNEIVQKMIAGYPRLYSDTSCVRALEDIYCHVTQA